MGKHTPLNEQRRLVALWRTTDLSMAAFARVHDLVPVTFGSWVARHTHVPSAPPEPPSFLQVVIAAPVAPASFSVCVGRHALRFEAPPPPAWFAAVVRELSPC